MLLKGSYGRGFVDVWVDDKCWCKDGGKKKNSEAGAYFYCAGKQR